MAIKYEAPIYILKEILDKAGLVIAVRA
ncbi:hypothetical protein [Paraflavitalea speifideaquila]